MAADGNPLTANPFGYPDTTGTPSNKDTVGKRRVFPTIGAGTGIFVTIGQSRIANISSSPAAPYTPTNFGKVFNLNPFDGLIYLLDDPILGCSYNPNMPEQRVSWQGRLADKLIAAGKYTQVLFIPIAQGGSSVADWMSGSIHSKRIDIAAAILSANSWSPSAWLWMQGTTDVINGMSQATYQTNLRSVIAYERAISGRSADKWMIALDSIKDNTGTTNAAIRAAQTAVQADANNVAGPDADSLPTTDYDSGPHFNDTGNDAIAGLWSTAIQAHL